MMQLYVRLRSAIFVESGFCLHLDEILPDGLRSEDNVLFATQDSAGKTHRLDPVPGCTGTGEDVKSIPLKPYPNPEAARTALVQICTLMGAAVRGDKAAQFVLGGAWSDLLIHGFKMHDQGGLMQLELLRNLYGADRVASCLAATGTLAGLGEGGSVEDVREALRLH